MGVATHPEFPHDLNGIWYVSETHHNIPPDYEGTRPVLGFEMPYYNRMGFPERHGLMQRAEIHYFRRDEQLLKLLSIKYVDAPPEMRAKSDDYAVVSLSLCHPYDFRRDMWDCDREEKYALGKFPALPYSPDGFHEDWHQLRECGRRVGEPSLRHGVW